MLDKYYNLLCDNMHHIRLPSIHEVRDRILEFREGRKGEWHPLGFFKLNIAQDFAGEGSSLQIHLWSSQYASEKPHSHSNNLKSLIVYGSVNVKNWALNPSKRPRDTLFLIQHRPNGEREYINYRSGNLKLLQDTIVYTGEMYEVKPGSLHTTSVNSASACTFVVRNGRKSCSSTCVDTYQDLISNNYVNREAKKYELDIICKLTK